MQNTKRDSLSKNKVDAYPIQDAYTGFIWGARTVYNKEIRWKVGNEKISKKRASGVGALGTNAHRVGH